MANSSHCTFASTFSVISTKPKRVSIWDGGSLPCPQTRSKQFIGLQHTHCSSKCDVSNIHVAVPMDEGIWPTCGSAGDLKTSSFSYSSSKKRKRSLCSIWRHLNTLRNFLDFMLPLVKCYVIIFSPWKTGLHYRWWLWDFCYLEQIWFLCFPSY